MIVSDDNLGQSNPYEGWSKESLAKELTELLLGIRNNLDDTDNLALGLKSGTYSEEAFMENYDSIVRDVEQCESIADLLFPR